MFHFAILLPLFVVLSSVQIVASGNLNSKIEEIREYYEAWAGADTLLSDKLDYNVHNVNKWGQTVLHLAISDDCPVDKKYRGAVVQLLIDLGAQVNTLDKIGFPPAYYAAKSYQWDVLKILLDNGADAEIKDDQGKSLLHFAAASKLPVPVDVLSRLINDGIDVNGCDQDGMAPLHHIRADNAEGIALFLIEHGADVNIRDHSDYTPLNQLLSRVLVNKAPWNACLSLIKNGADEKSIEKARKYIADQKSLNDKLADFNTVVAQSRLMNKSERVAATESSVPKSIPAKVLDRQKVDLNDVKDYCKIAKHLRELLKDYNYDLQAVNKCGETVLHRIARGDYVVDKECLDAVVQRLIDLGVSVNTLDEKGLPPAYYAAKSCQWDTLKTLIDSGAEISKIKDSDGRSLLHFAAASCSISVDMLAILIKGGVGVNDLDANGRTPLHYLKGPKAGKSALYLIECGANVNNRNSFGLTPLDEFVLTGLHGCSPSWDVCSVLIENGADSESIDQTRVYLKNHKQGNQVFDDAIFNRDSEKDGWLVVRKKKSK